MRLKFLPCADHFPPILTKFSSGGGGGEGWEGAANSMDSFGCQSSRATDSNTIFMLNLSYSSLNRYLNHFECLKGFLQIVKNAAHIIFIEVCRQTWQVRPNFEAHWWHPVWFSHFYSGEFLSRHIRTYHQLKIQHNETNFTLLMLIDEKHVNIAIL